jgi:hypothetical protein
MAVLKMKPTVGFQFCLERYRRMFARTIAVSAVALPRPARRNVGWGAGRTEPIGKAAVLPLPRRLPDARWLLAIDRLRSRST